MIHRKQLILRLFEVTQKVYIKFKKKTPWGITTQELLLYPESTFGNQLGLFLYENGFDLIPKVERHDAYHVLTGFGTAVEDEIALQYLCFGNGKRTPYLAGVITLGTLLLPEYLPYYLKTYRIGKSSNPFHQFDFKKLLKTGYTEFRNTIFSERELKELNILQRSTTKTSFIIKSI